MSMIKPMRKLIRVDGTVEELHGPISMAAIEQLIGATDSGLDTVNLRHLGQPLLVMLVDDQGHKKGLPVNEEATRLYHANCVEGSEPPPIVGDVVIVPDHDYA